MNPHADIPESLEQKLAAARKQRGRDATLVHLLAIGSFLICQTIRGASAPSNDDALTLAAVLFSCALVFFVWSFVLGCLAWAHPASIDLGRPVACMCISELLLFALWFNIYFGAAFIFIAASYAVFRAGPKIGGKVLIDFVSILLAIMSLLSLMRFLLKK